MKAAKHRIFKIFEIIFVIIIFIKLFYKINYLQLFVLRVLRLKSLSGNFYT